MKCYKCNQELTTGDIGLVCSNCKLKEQVEYPITFGMYGWICPRCGTCHSPFTPSCGCVPPTITCTTNIEGDVE